MTPVLLESAASAAGWFDGFIAVWTDKPVDIKKPATIEGLIDLEKTRAGKRIAIFGNNTPVPKLPCVRQAHATGSRTDDGRDVWIVA